MNGAAVTGDPRLRIGVLGPLLIIRDGAAIRLPRGRAGVLLAVLAMSAGRPAGTGRLAGLRTSAHHGLALEATVFSRLTGFAVCGAERLAGTAVTWGGAE
jgi:hypothetical protein